jgi:uncharacterized coiled-coil protein SlyX
MSAGGRQSGIPGVNLAALQAIKDENVRIVLEGIIAGLNVRNGITGTGDNAFITASEVGKLKRDYTGLFNQLNELVTNNQPGISPGEINRIINDLQGQVMASELFVDLGTTIGRKAKIFWQSTAPSGTEADPLKVNDLWLKSDEGNRLYRWNGSEWVESADTRIATTKAGLTAEIEDRVEAVQAVADDLVAEANARFSADSVLGGYISTLETTSASHATMITSLNTKVGTAESNITTLQTTTASQGTALTSLTTKVGTAETNITNLQTTTASQGTALTSLTTKVGTAETNISTLQTTTASQGTMITSLNTKVGTAESNISTLQTTTTAHASTLTTLTSKVGTAESNITSLQTTTSGHASTLTTLTSKMSSAESAIVAEQTARTNADNAITSSMTSQFSTVNSSISSLSTELTTTNTAVAANASAITSVSSSVGALTSTVSSNHTTMVSVTGEINSKHTVKIDTNGYVTGYGLISTANNAAPTSEFIVRADRFSIGSPTGPGITPRIPFVVLTSTDAAGNPPGIYADMAVIKNAATPSGSVTITAFNTWYDIGSVSVDYGSNVPGSVLVFATSNFTYSSGTGETIYELQILHNGTTVGSVLQSAPSGYAFSASGAVTVAGVSGTNTFTMRVRRTFGGTIHNAGGRAVATWGARR